MTGLSSETRHITIRKRLDGLLLSGEHNQPPLTHDMRTTIPRTIGWTIRQKRKIEIDAGIRFGSGERV